MAPAAVSCVAANSPGLLSAFSPAQHAAVAATVSAAVAVSERFRIRRRVLSHLTLGWGEHVAGMVVTGFTRMANPLLVSIGLMLVPHKFGFGALAVASATGILVAATNRGLGLTVLRWFDLAWPADERVAEIVTSTASRVGVHATSIWVVRHGSLDAWAYPASGRLVFTERIIRELGRAELEAVAAHELAHLGEPRRMRWLRGSGSLALLGLIATGPLQEVGDRIVAGWIGACLAWMLVVRRVARRLEQRADGVASAFQGEAGTYARALESLYRLNLVPAVTRRAVHPPLYDRLLATGAAPDYPRPRPPSSLRLLLGTVAPVVLGFALFVAGHVGLYGVSYAAHLADIPVIRHAALAVSGGDADDLLRLADRAPDPGQRALVLRAAAEAAAERPGIVNRATIAVARGGRCDDAQAILRGAEARATSSAEKLESARRWVRWCRERKPRPDGLGDEEDAPPEED
jgi:Zn-dependent protease with chaperone function